MKVLIAGATGVVGTELIKQLGGTGHEVLGLARGEAAAASLRARGVQPVVADALDREGLLRAVAGLQADAVLHELTALKKTPTRPKHLVLTNRLRIEGTANLLAAARELGATRFVTQSFFGGYGRHDGSRLLVESDVFGPDGGGRLGPSWQAMRSTEEQARGADRLNGSALRYGGFYGPGVIDPLVTALRKRQLPVPGGGGAYASFIHVADAAAATIAALDHAKAGEVYNVCDDEPVRWGDILGAIAAAYGAPRPMSVPGWLLRLVAPYVGVVFTRMSLRLSNEKAKRELDWIPRFPTYREGIADCVKQSIPV